MKLRRAFLPGRFLSARPPAAHGSSDGGDLAGLAGAAVAVTSSALPSAGPAVHRAAEVDPAVSEKYRIVEVLDPGPPDARYLAERLDTGAAVELRVLSGQFAADRVLVTALSQQSTVVTRVSGRSPGIATVYEWTRVPSGAFVLASERPEGPTLREVIRREGTLGRERALRLAIEIAQKLEWVHNLALVHGGLRPDNVVLVGADERVVLTQFGFDWLILSRSRGGGSDIASTRGPEAYQAPEQAFDQATQRSDVYALGAILYEMLAGSPPSTGTRFRRLRPESLRRCRADVPANLDRVVMRALQVEPDRRPPDISTLCNDLWAELNSGESGTVVRRADGATGAPATRTGSAPTGLGQRLKTEARTLSSIVGSPWHRLIRRREERAAAPAARGSSADTPHVAGPASGWGSRAMVFRLTRHVRGLNGQRGGANADSRPIKRMKHVIAWGSFAVAAALTVWLAHARLTSHTPTLSHLATPSAPIAAPIPNESVPTVVSGVDGPTEVANRPGVDTVTPANSSPGSVSRRDAPSPSPSERPLHHGDSQKTPAAPSSLPSALTPQDRIEPIGPSSVHAGPRPGTAPRQRRQMPAAPERSASRETSEATEEDPGAIIDWLLSGVPAQRR